VTQRGYQRIVPPHLCSGKLGPSLNAVTQSLSENARSSWFGRSRTGREAKSAHRFTSTQIAATAKRRLRCGFDLACAAAGLAVLAPVFAIIAMAIKLDDGGPVLYSHLRVGKNLRPFRFLKFRSMVSSTVPGSPVTAPHDTRVTRVGRVLRKYKLDELPQLVNVWKSEMQLVGSRPQMEKHVEMFRAEYEELLQSPPGITDLATLSFRNEERFFHEGSIEEQYIEKIMPVKLQLALRYSRTRTFRSDLEIIFRTVLGLGAPPAAWRSANGDPATQSLSEYLSENL
jgi:lipopolysaccharide/colanic/teichoic acid biosynthesis glycosyltransferase